MTNNTIPNVPRELTIERDVFGAMHIKLGDFDFIQIQYQHPYTDNASTKTLAERIAAILSAPSPAGVDGLGNTAKLLLPALRQYMHNDGSGLLAGYDLETTQAIIDGLRAENETLRKRAKTAEREAESALKTYKGLEKVARVVSDNSDQVCGELNVMRQERDQLAQRMGDMEQILRDLMPGCKGPLMRQRIEAAPSAGKEVEAPGPAPVVKLCVACRTLHPVDHFDKAAPDFPTRDGLNCNCRKSVAERGYRLMRLPNGKVEPRP